MCWKLLKLLLVFSFTARRSLVSTANLLCLPENQVLQEVTVAEISLVFRSQLVKETWRNQMFLNREFPYHPSEVSQVSLLLFEIFPLLATFQESHQSTESNKCLV